MSNVITGTSENFDEVTPGILTIVDFSATWCGPCKQFAPVFEASADARPDIAHVKVDVDEAPDLAGRYEVMSVPTTLFMREGIVVGKVPGALNAARLADLIGQAEALSMEEIRAAL